MGCNYSPTNGGLTNHNNNSIVDKVGQNGYHLPSKYAVKLNSHSISVTSSHSAVQQLLAILRSIIPYFMFLFIYGINPYVHILPRFSDLGCITLHNVSAFEQTILPTGIEIHRLISHHSAPFLDILSAIPYLMHYVLPILYPLYLFCNGRQIDKICQFYWLLGWAMIVHIIFWFLLPTAPPWVYDNWARWQANHTTPPPLHLQHKEGCAFARLDARSGVPFFFNMFSTNPVPFGSFPSGHVSWPMCILITGAPGGRWFALYVFYVAWATLYSCHHYVSDAVAAAVIVLALRRVLAYVSDRRARNEMICPAIVCSLNMV